MKTRMFILSCGFILSGYAGALAAVPLSAESWQLQRLVNNSEKQLQIVHELLNSAQKDNQALDHAEEMLAQLTRGLNKSIETFQGTKAYNQALLDVQADETFARGQADGAQSNKQGTRGPNLEKFVKFQSDSVTANLNDMSAQNKLESALRTAEPGFVPKLQTQAQLGGWQTNTRISAQLTQLLAAIQGLREEMRASQSGAGLTPFLEGAALQNKKQLEGGGIHGQR